MICATCGRRMVSCICDDADERILSLQNCPTLHIDVVAIMAQRYLNRFDIARDKAKEAKKP